jgi:hypothetical protein
MSEPKCETCRWWKLVELCALPEGECRRNTPMMQGQIAPHGNSVFQNPAGAVWPQCNRSDWCGQHQHKNQTNQDDK